MTGIPRALPGGGGRVAGKVALVAGGGSRHPVAGVGQAISMLLAREGARVAVADIDAGAAENTVAAISTAGGQALAAVGDVTVEDDCARAVAVAVGRFGRLDILVNAVGLAATAGLADLTASGWARMLEVNAHGAVKMTRHAVGAMEAGGAVVNVSSIAANRPPAGRSAGYAVAKAAVEALTAVMAVEYAPRGVRANCVRPGELWTAMIARGYSAAQGERVRARQSARSLLGTEGTAWDAAHAILFLASDEARWVTGQVLTVDGGWSLRRPGP